MQNILIEGANIGTFGKSTQWTRDATKVMYLYRTPWVTSPFQR